jgi:hypothetical protein
MFWKLPEELTRIYFRIEKLKKNPELGTEIIGFDEWGEADYSNCHGTTMFVHGFGERNDRPVPVAPLEMKEFLKQKCIEIPRSRCVGGIVGLWDYNGGLQHTAVPVRLKWGDEKIFHQADVGERFRFSTRRRYMNDFFGLGSPFCQAIRLSYHQVIHK